MKGTVKWFNEKKGFGFLSTTEGKDVFVHFSAIENSGGFKTLNQGDSVEFNVVESDKGPKAENVKVLSVGETSASIFYNTTKDAYGFVEYGLDDSLGKTVTEGSLSRSHVIVLPDLFPGETYYFKVGVNDKSFGNGLGDVPFSFTTKTQE